MFSLLSNCHVPLVVAMYQRVSQLKPRLAGVMSVYYALPAKPQVISINLYN